MNLGLLYGSPFCLYLFSSNCRKSFSTSSIRRSPPTSRLPFGLVSVNSLGTLVSSLLITDSSHSTLIHLISALRPGVPCSFCSSRLVHIPQTSCSVTGPYTFLSLLIRHVLKKRSQDSSVDIATGYGVGYSCSVTGRDKIFVFIPQRLDRLWGPPSLLCSGYRGVKRPKSEADHSHASSAEVKNDGAIPPLHHTSSWHGV
jgi:hypothetical protein